MTTVISQGLVSQQVYVRGYCCESIVLGKHIYVLFYRSGMVNLFRLNVKMCEVFLEFCMLLVGFKNFNFCDIYAFQMHMIKIILGDRMTACIQFLFSCVIVAKQVMCFCTSAYTNNSHFTNNLVFWGG